MLHITGEEAARGVRDSDEGTIRTQELLRRMECATDALLGAGGIGGHVRVRQDYAEPLRGIPDKQATVAGCSDGEYGSRHLAQPRPAGHEMEDSRGLHGRCDIEKMAIRTERPCLLGRKAILGLCKAWQPALPRRPLLP